MGYSLIHKIEEFNLEAWNQLLDQHPDGNVFQSHTMYELFRRTEKFNPVLLGVTKNNTLKGVLLGVIIKEYKGALGLISSRTVIYGGPIIDSENQKELKEILDLLLDSLVKKVKNKSVFIQFRNFFDWKACNDVFSKYNFHFFERLNYLVDTTIEDVTYTGISNSKRRQIRKGLKDGAVIGPPQSVEEMRQFYRILRRLYKSKVKKPLPSWSFFKNFYLLSKEGKLGIIELIKYQNKIIGGIVSPVSSGKTIYEWYICGLDDEYKKLYPSVLATYAPIKYALENNIRAFDFMGVGVPDKDYGVREFKSKFGGKLVNFGRFGRINNRIIYLITEFGFNILSLIKKI